MLSRRVAGRRHAGHHGQGERGTRHRAGPAPRGPRLPPTATTVTTADWSCGPGHHHGVGRAGPPRGRSRVIRVLAFSGPETPTFLGPWPTTLRASGGTSSPAPVTRVSPPPPSTPKAPGDIPLHSPGSQFPSPFRRWPEGVQVLTRTRQDALVLLTQGQLVGGQLVSTQETSQPAGN